MKKSFLILFFSHLAIGLFSAEASAQEMRKSTFGPEDWDFRATALDVPFTTHRLGNNFGGPETSIIRLDGEFLLDVVWTPDSDKHALGFSVSPNWKSVVKRTFVFRCTFVPVEIESKIFLQLVNGNFSQNGKILSLDKDGSLLILKESGDTVALEKAAQLEVDSTYSLVLSCDLDNGTYEVSVKGLPEPLSVSGPLPGSPSDYDNGLAAFEWEAEEPVRRTRVLFDDIIIEASGINSVDLGEPVAYYVSPEGSDSNDGLTPQSPLRTPQVAANKTNPGDTVYFMEGLYLADNGKGLLTIRNSGAPAAPITFRAFEDEKPVFKLLRGWNHILIQASYIVVDGIVVEGNNENITLEEAEGIYEHFVSAKDEGKEYDSQLISLTGPNGIKALGTRHNPVHHITIRNCIVSKVPGGGISAVKADYILIENNHIFETCRYGIYGTSGISLLNLTDIDNNTTDYKVIIRGNRSHDNISLVKWERVRRMSDGNGCIIDFNQNTNDPNLPPYKGRFLVANNLFYRNGGSGVHVFKSDNVDVVNNTIYDNNQNPELKHYSNMFAKNASNVRFLNNIVYAGPDELIILPPEDGTVIFANNIYFGDEQPYLGANDRYIQPHLVSVHENDFRLARNSPAVDTGVATLAPKTDIREVERPRGNGFDVGAYESRYASETPLLNNHLDLEEMVVGFNHGTAEAHRGSPEIDGKIEKIWLETQPIYPDKLIVGDPNFVMASAEARMLWDEKALYVLVIVEDDQLSDVAEKPWLKDSVEIFIDRENNKTRYYDSDDAQHRISYRNDYSGPASAKVRSSVSETESGYVLEIALKWGGQGPAPGETIGFDLQINDADLKGERETVLMWSTFHDSAYTNTSQFGNLKLLE